MSDEPEIKLCALCGRPVIGRNRNAKYCCEACQKQARKNKSRAYQTAQRRRLKEGLNDYHPGYETTNREYYDAHRNGPDRFALDGKCPYAEGLLQTDAIFLPVY